MVCIEISIKKEFRNSSWYQSHFSETLIPSGHLLFKPSFIPAKSLWPSLNPTISLSGHLSFRPSVPVLKAKGEKQNRRQKIFTAGDFSGELFRRRLFPTPQGAPGGDLQFFPKDRGQKTIHALATRVFSDQQLHLTCQRVRAR